MSSNDSKEPLTAAERMRVYRKRRGNGFRCVRVLLHETEINSLVDRGFLKQERRHVQGAVESAINGFVLCALGDTE